MDASRKDRARDALQKDLDATEAKLKVDNPEYRLIYDNQKEVALDIVDAFITQDVYLAVLIAEMQVGKTGACLATAFHMCMHPDNYKVIDLDNVVILTGLSDTEWKEQTKMSMVQSFQKNVFHRSNFKEERLVKLLKHGRDMLLIIDESHIATQISHKLSLLLKEVGILDISNMKERNIKILQVSATPGATLQDSEDWGKYSKVFKLSPSPSYVGFAKLINANRLRDALELSKYENVLSLATVIRSEYKSPKYHILRVKGCNSAIQNIGRLCIIHNWLSINHNSQDRWDSELLETPPCQHTFILIKDFWRASKRLCDKHIGIVHEAYVRKPDANANAQGLAGRCCGNDKQQPGTGTPMVYCNMKAIEQYIAWVNANGNYKDVLEYSSRDINVSKGQVKSQATLNHHSNVLGLDEVVPKSTNERILYEFPPWNKDNGFATLTEMNAFLKMTLGKNIRLREFHQVDNFKLSTRLTTYYGKPKEQLTANDRLTYSDYNVNMASTNIASEGKKGQHYMVYPVYANKDAPSSSVRYYYSVLKNPASPHN